MALDKLMEQFQKEMELERSLMTEVQDVYALPLDEGITITIRYSPQAGGICFECPLIDCPRNNEELYYTTLLSANLFGQGTKGSVLGLNVDGSVVTLTLVIDYDIEYKEFRDLLEDFINNVDFWREETQVHVAK